MLFVYGTLQDADILSAVLGRRIDVTALQAAVAPGYRTVAYPGRVYPALAASSGDSAPGLLLDGLAAMDVAILDAFEGAEYRRATIAVRVEGTVRQADAYLPAKAVSATAPVWSLQEWTRAHKPAVLEQESATAAVLRGRLTSRPPG